LVFLWLGRRRAIGAMFAKGRLAGLALADGQNETKPKIARLYAGLIRDVERLSGVRRSPADTPHEYVGQVAASLEGAGIAVGAVTDSYVEKLYSPRSVGPEDVTSFAAGVKGARKAVRAHIKPIWRTAPAWMSRRIRGLFADVVAVIRMRREDRQA
jgi:hypothetical protein